jgi:hypothetical protein
MRAVLRGAVSGRMAAGGTSTSLHPQPAMSFLPPGGVADRDVWDGILMAAGQRQFQAYSPLS